MYMSLIAIYDRWYKFLQIFTWKGCNPKSYQTTTVVNGQSKSKAFLGTLHHTFCEALYYLIYLIY